MKHELCLSKIEIPLLILMSSKNISSGNFIIFSSLVSEFVRQHIFYAITVIGIKIIFPIIYDDFVVSTS